jgi:tight adherence protein B
MSPILDTSSVLATVLAAGCSGLFVINLAKFRKTRGRLGTLREQVDSFRQVGVEEVKAVDFFGESEHWGDSSVEVPLSDDSAENKIKPTRRSLEARLRYAELAWIPLTVVSLVQIIISLTAAFFAYLHLKPALQLFALFSGPLIVNWLINRRIAKRVASFDRDFAQFLLSVVAMLKTGLNPIQAIETAAKNLEEGSIVREEVEIMLERVRLGVSEDRSIGAFGENIDQPEIELFVQALLLSRRVGGSLADTLDRISKQVRKRQQFKRAASGAVSMQRGSIWAIIVVISLVELYMFIFTPEMVVGAWTDPRLAGFAQGALVIVAAALLLIKRITSIRI